MENSDLSMDQNQKLTLASTSVGFALENMDYNVVSFVMTSMMASIGFSAAAGGLIQSVTNIGMLFGGLFFGLLADRFGRVKIFTYTIFLFAVCTGAMYFANSLPVIYILRFFGGCAEGGEAGAGVTLIAENFPHRRIGKLISITAIGGQIGSIITALAATFILTNPKNWHYLFLVGLIPAFLAFVIRKNMHESKQFKQISHKKNYQNQVSLKELFKDPKISWQTVGLSLMVLIQVAGYYGLMNWLPTIMQKQLHLNVSKSSSWMIVTTIGMCLGMWAFGYIMDHYSPRVSYGIFLICSALAVYLIAIAFNVWTLLLACTVVGFFTNGMYSGYGAIISRLYPMSIRATANNFIMNVGKAVGGFSPAIIGLLTTMGFSWFKVMMMLSVLYVISFGIMFTIPNLRKLARKIMA